MSPTAAGRLISETVNGKTLTYNYNADAELSQLTALGAVTDYTRSNRGLVTAIDGPAGPFGFNYDATGRLTGLTRPNGTATAYGYDAASQLTRITHSGGFNATYRYTFDTAGRITGWNSDGPNWNYQYDSAGRLTQATHGSENFGYAYDAVGNRTSNGGQYNADNQLLENAEHTFAYDTRGNLTQKTNKQTGAHVEYSWNARGQLIAVEYHEDASVTKTLTYAYGPLGRRWQKTEDGTTRQFVYAGADRIATLDAGGNLLTRVTFAPGIDRPLGSTGSLDVYYHVNHQGSVMALTGPSGSVQAQYSYSPFGQTTVSAPSTNAFAYTARARDAKNLYYYRARYYDPSLGRFISEDPIGFASGTTNLYAYVLGNPVNLVDPNGRFAVAAIPAIVGGIMGGISGGVGAAIQGGDWSDIAVGIGVGATAGVAAGYASTFAWIGLVGEVAISGAANAIANYFGQTLTSNGPVNVASVIGSGIGGMLGALPGAFLGRLGPRVPGFLAQLGAGVTGLKGEVAASAIGTALGAYQTGRPAAGSGLGYCPVNWPVRPQE